MPGSLAGSDVPQFFVSVLALGVVLAMIWGLGWLARRMPWVAASGRPDAEGGLVLRGSLRLDSRRRVHLVEAGGVQALVLTGGASEVVMRLSPPGG